MSTNAGSGTELTTLPVKVPFTGATTGYAELDDVDNNGGAVADDVGVKNVVVTKAHRTAAPIVFFQRLFPERFYGWMVVMACSIVWFNVAPSGSFSVGFFIEKWLTDESMLVTTSRTQLSLYWTIAQLSTSLLTPVTGRIYDILGARKLIALIAGPFLISIFSFGKLYNVHLAVPLFVTLRVTHTTFVVLTMTATGQWFVKMRGAAAAWHCSVGALTLGFPSVLSGLGKVVPWRDVALLETLFCGLCILCVWILLVGRPEEFGLWPDGIKPTLPDVVSTGGKEDCVSDDANGDGDNDVQSNAEVVTTVNTSDTTTGAGATPATANDANGELCSSPEDLDQGWHYKHALKTSFFWAVAMNIAASGALWSGVNFHYVNILKDFQGGTETGVSLLYTTVAVVSFVATVGSGWLIDKFKRKHHSVTVGSVCGALCALLCLKLNVWYSVVGMASLFGIMDAVMFMALSVVFAEAYGPKHLGTINSVAMGAHSVSMGLGPLLFGISKDYFGGYSAIFVSLAVVLSLGSFVLFLPLKLVNPATRANGR